MNLPYSVLGLIVSNIIEDNEFTLAHELIEYLDSVEGEIHIESEEEE